VSNRDLGRALGSIKMNNGKSCLDNLKASYYSVRTFLEKYPEVFHIGESVFSGTGYEYVITVDPSICLSYQDDVSHIRTANRTFLDKVVDELIKVRFLTVLDIESLVSSDTLPFSQ
jgi:hypothetical protein